MVFLWVDLFVDKLEVKLVIIMKVIGYIYVDLLIIIFFLILGYKESKGLKS